MRLFVVVGSACCPAMHDERAPRGASAHDVYNDTCRKRLAHMRLLRRTLWRACRRWAMLSVVSGYERVGLRQGKIQQPRDEWCLGWP